MLRTIIVGSKGRMGQALIRLIEADPETQLAGGIDAGDDIDSILPEADAIIEFSHHSVTVPLLEKAKKFKVPVVIGTTGHSAEEKAAIQAAGLDLPIVFAPNYSVGVNVLFHIVKKTAQILGPHFDQEIFEMHHRLKVDAPSGTARRLGEILAEVKGRDYDDVIVNGRVGEPGKRTKHEVGMHAFRGGDVVGDHTVFFAAMGERLELTHRASSRDTFAGGAIRAAKWLKNQGDGVFTMQDVLGLND
ncbi:MAG: 4-hydroxy-tetrahydrodipicolinate reductase [Candidatus Methylacidiphilales bacterium]|nr:4-hydroxy-tetrahydrodipicolinate reductase [Candidatus Methylacidiphilales bacterium]